MAAALAPIYGRLADAATFTPGDAAPSDCSIIIERDLSRYGDALDLGLVTAELSVRVSELPRAPRRGDVFTVTATGEAFQVHTPISQDGYEYRCIAA